MKTNWLKHFIWSLLLIILCGCTAGRYTGVQSISTDSIAKEQERQFERLQQIVVETMQTSAINKETYIKDSCTIILNDVGEIVSREVIRYQDRNISEKEIVSIVQQRIDSIMEAKFENVFSLIENSTKVPVPVEKKLTAWERLKLDYFMSIVALLIISLVYIFRKPIFTFIRRNC